MTEQQIEQALIEKLGELKYAYHLNIRDRAALKPHIKRADAAAFSGHELGVKDG